MSRQQNSGDSSNQRQDADITEQMNMMETDVLQRISSVAKYKRKPQYFLYETDQQQQLIEYEEKMDYYSQFWRMFLINQILINQIKQLSSSVKEMQQKVNDIDTIMNKYFELSKIKNKKKNRRLATEIQKSYKCPYSNCFKQYGTDVSLNLHIKIKHNGGNKTQREALARQYWNAVEKHLPLPLMYLNFPPGYIQQFKKNKAT